jgi:hypothetical protein
MLTGRCHRYPMLPQEMSAFPRVRDVGKRTLFFPVSFVLVDHGSSLVIGHEGNLQARMQVASSAFGLGDDPSHPRHLTCTSTRPLTLTPSLHQNLMDIVSEPHYEPTSPNSETFVLPYDDPDVVAGALPPEPSLASRIGKSRVYLYSESDAASRLGKVRLQLRRNFR